MQDTFSAPWVAVMLAKFVASNVNRHDFFDWCKENMPEGWSQKNMMVVLMRDWDKWERMVEK